MGMGRGGPEMTEQRRHRPGDPQNPTPSEDRDPRGIWPGGRRAGGDQELKADGTMELGRSSAPLGTSKGV